MNLPSVDLLPSLYLHLHPVHHPHHSQFIHVELLPIISLINKSHPRNRPLETFYLHENNWNVG